MIWVDVFKKSDICFVCYSDVDLLVDDELGFVKDCIISRFGFFIYIFVVVVCWDNILLIDILESLVFIVCIYFFRLVILVWW